MKAPVAIRRQVATLDHPNEDIELPSDACQERREHRPRAERFPIRTPLRYREGGQADWNEGTTVNISRSGVLFSAEKNVEPKTVLELRIMFPAEVIGGVPANVVCWGPVVRTQPNQLPDQRPELAVAIHRYRLTREK